MITWKKMGDGEIAGINSDQYVIYYTICYSWGEIECTVWSEKTPSDPKRMIAAFKQKNRESL